MANANKYLESGEFFEGTAAAVLTTGDVVFDADGRPGVITAMNGVAVGQRYKAQTSGVYSMKAKSDDVWAAGAILYYDLTNERLTDIPNAYPIGRAAADKADAATTALVRLDPTINLTGVGNVKHLRVRATVAEVNAGLTLLPAHPNKAYRMTDCSMIAVGGAAATATAVRVNGTQSASVVQLVSNAVGALTQNTRVLAGVTANSTILAGGVSFAACDVNTAITLDKSGSNLATATHIDVLLSYVEEAA